MRIVGTSAGNLNVSLNGVPGQTVGGLPGQTVGGVLGCRGKVRVACRPQSRRRCVLTCVVHARACVGSCWQCKCNKLQMQMQMQQIANAQTSRHTLRSAVCIAPQNRRLMRERNKEQIAGWRTRHTHNSVFTVCSGASTPKGRSSSTMGNCVIVDLQCSVSCEGDLGLLETYSSPENKRVAETLHHRVHRHCSVESVQYANGAQR